VHLIEPCDTSTSLLFVTMVAQVLALVQLPCRQSDMFTLISTFQAKYSHAFYLPPLPTAPTSLSQSRMVHCCPFVIRLRVIISLSLKEEIKERTMIGLRDSDKMIDTQYMLVIKLLPLCTKFIWVLENLIKISFIRNLVISFLIFILLIYF
jgi:hypothetical protein